MRTLRRGNIAVQNGTPHWLNPYAKPGAFLAVMYGSGENVAEGTKGGSRVTVARNGWR